MKAGHIRITNKIYFEPDDEKLLIEVNNFWREFPKIIVMLVENMIENIKDNQPCKAVIIDNKATIVELIKLGYELKEMWSND